MIDKIIVSNREALTRKYGAAGVAKIKRAVEALIAADAKLGIKSQFVYLDDAVAMKRFKGRAVTDPIGPKQNKEAVDAIFRIANPEYLMILGAPDVVPHQDLSNPLFDPPNEPDRYALGDLPYACDAPYSRDIAKFKGPVRVVGRLPDLAGAPEPSHIISLLSMASKYRSQNVAAYATYFGMSTDSWRKSTELSLSNAFGNSDRLTLAPPNGPTHPAARLAPLSHFINCHGASNTPEFYGEKGTAQPISLTSNGIKKKIKIGTVAAVECCYGAELYDSITLSSPLPICQRYLIQGAYGFFGSTTIAYGPAVGNGAADLITQYFLLAVLEGSSLGRAALTARQRFVKQTGELDPADLKTLGQFYLLGDPSITPVKIESATSIPRGTDVHAAKRQQRLERRAKLRIEGEMLQATKPTASRKAGKARKSAPVERALANIARVAGIGTKTFTAFKVQVPKGARPRGSKAVSTASRYHVAVYQPKRPLEHTEALRIVAVAKEVEGRIVGYRVYTEK